MDLSSILEMTTEEQRRFWSKAIILGQGECWRWQGAKAAGYGTITFRQRLYQATHVALALARKMPADGKACALHVCDNPSCINPAHLWWGDKKENALDCRSKGRVRGQDQTHCSRGHEYSPENTYWRPHGARDCRACIRDRANKYRGRAA